MKLADSIVNGGKIDHSRAPSIGAASEKRVDKEPRAPNTVPLSLGTVTLTSKISMPMLPNGSTRDISRNAIATIRKLLERDITKSRKPMDAKEVNSDLRGP